MSAGRPTLALSRKTPLKSKKLGTTSGKKKGGVVGMGGPTVPTTPSQPPQPKPWVETVTDLGQYKPSKEELEAKKAARKSNNKVLAKVINDRIYKYYKTVTSLVRCPWQTRGHSTLTLRGTG